MGSEFFLIGKIFVLITGASKDIGREIAIKYSNILDNGSHFLLIARNKTGLRETTSRMSNRVHVDYASIDLSIAKADQLEDLIRKRVNPHDYDGAVVIHDVGSVGDISPLTDEMDNFGVWEKCYNLNVFSPAVLTSAFMKIFNDKVRAKKLVINLTSWASLTPYQSLGYYNSAEAAREMYFKVFAKEFPKVNVLNYSPHMVDTDLLRKMESINRTSEVPEYIRKSRREGKVITTIQAANGLFDIIKKHNYKSGDHVDYFYYFKN
ncbi:GSCOCG00003197001-RA-CDS [Cotesia congregata]|nr:GSCOCG00003197001-RA-CDS [Cotesia congregata]